MSHLVQILAPLDHNVKYIKEINITERMKNGPHSQIAVKPLTPDMLPVYGFILVQIVHLLFLTIQGQFVLNSYESVYFEM